MKAIMTAVGAYAKSAVNYLHSNKLRDEEKAGVVTLEFYRKHYGGVYGYGWYCNVPGWMASGGGEGSMAMVAGADTWLDRLNTGNKDRIYLRVSYTTPLAEKLDQIHYNMTGSTYVAHTFRGEEVNHELWLCPLTLEIFPHYPEVIYYELTNDQGNTSSESGGQTLQAGDSSAD